MNAAALQEAKPLGMAVNDVADIEQFRKAVSSVYTKYVNLVGGQGTIQSGLDTK